MSTRSDGICSDCLNLKDNIFIDPSDIYDLFMSDNKTKDDSTVSFRVFCPEGLRTQFKVYCAKEQTNMSEKCRELIERWINEKQQEEAS